MMRSMYSGVAGLKTHQTKMDVIGNNIANVNTVAYKSQSVTFSELMYQTTQNASGANAETGTAGINARQIGLGVKTGAINTAITSQGASQTTNNPFDIRITGNSFFIVSNMQDTFFTRDGSFYVDGVGNLAMTSNGYNVMGWQVDPETLDIKQDTVSPLRIMSAENMTYAPEATTKGRVTGIIDKLDTNIVSSSGKIMNFMFYDKLGYPYTAKFTIKNTDEDGTYTLQLNSILDASNNVVATGAGLDTASSEVKASGTISMAAGYSWDDTGNLVYSDGGVTKYVQQDGTLADASGTGNLTKTSIPENMDETIWPALAKAYNYPSATEFKSMKFTATDTSDTTKTVDITMREYLTNANVTLADNSTASAWTLMGIADNAAFNAATPEYSAITRDGSAQIFYDTATGKFLGVGNVGTNAIVLALSADPENEFEDIEIDFSTTTMYNNSGTSTVSASAGDENKLGAGRKLGRMSGVSIQDDGRIYASYDNGMSRLLGQIAVAEFANASGLEKEGDNLYKNTQNSGDFDGIGIDIKSGGGYMTTGVLEMSNVDLSAEFTDMITTQRGFQANSRIITVSDTLLEELVNLKR